MAHASSLRRRQTRNIGDQRLLHVVAGPECGFRFLRAADLADHQHGVGARILLEQLQHVLEGRAVDRVPPIRTEVETPMPSAFIWLAAS